MRKLWIAISLVGIPFFALAAVAVPQQRYAFLFFVLMCVVLLVRRGIGPSSAAEVLNRKPVTAVIWVLLLAGLAVVLIQGR